MISIRHWLFVGLILLLSAIVWCLVWFQLIVQMALPNWAHSFLAVLFVASYITQMILLLCMHAKNPHPGFVFIAFFFMGLFIHLFCATLTKNILIFIPWFAAHEKLLCYLFAPLAVFFNFWGIRTALRGPQIKHVFIPLPPHQVELNGYKIVQISDLHVGPLLGKNYIQKIVDTTNLLRANLIVLTGDIGDSNADFFGKELAPLKSLHSKEGTFYITGNHEYYWGVEKWIEVLRQCGARPLLNEGLLIAGNKIWLGGITDIDGAHFIHSHAPDPIQSLNQEKAKNTYKILLAHQPKNCFSAEKAGYDLMLSGHTHGGQFFPINLLVGFFNPYSKGLNRHQNMWVYVNRGTGFWGPALRLGVPSEITLLEFKA